MVFILITLSLDAVGFGLIAPVMPDLLRSVTGGDLAHAALWGGLLTGGFAAMQFLCGPVIGNLSDRFGRRPVLLISLGVLAADYAVLSVAQSIWLILAARLITGAASSTYGTSMALIADISTPEEKVARFGLSGAAFGIGFVLGPLIGGLLAEYGPRAPFIAAGCVAAGNFLFGLFFQRETLSPMHRRAFELRRANPFGAFRAIGRMAGLGVFLAIYALYEFAFTVYPVIWAYFTPARFGWSPGMVGLSLAYFGIGFAVVQAVLIGPASRRLGRFGAVGLGLAAASLSFATLTWIESGWWALVLVPISTLAGFVNPGIRAELSDRVPADQQGELQGALSSLRAVGMMSAPFVFTWTFAATTGEAASIHWPGAVFAIPAALNALALFLLLSPRTRRS